MISLRYAPFHHHIVIFPTLFYFRFLGVTSLTNEQKENIILGDIKITEVKDGDVASVPPKGGMGSLITITSAIDESIPKSNDNVNKKREYHSW